MRLLPDFNLRLPVKACFVPSDRFFLRFVPLAPDLPALEQVGLALEGLAPFPPAQLYWGCWVAPGRTTALVYAAHRRRFSGGEGVDWAGADLVVPDLLPLLGAIPTGPALMIYVGENHLVGGAWPSGATAPSVTHARAYAEPITEADRRQFAAELAARANLPDAPPTFLAGHPRIRREGNQFVFELVDAAGKVVAATAMAHLAQDELDVRDRAFLDRRRQERRRGNLIWKVALAGLQMAAVALLFDLGTLTFRLIGRGQQARLTEQTSAVNRLETAHGLASRIDDLTHRRLKFFEMLAAINEARPPSIQFTRTGTSGRNGLEIEAQTSSTNDVGAYESALRGLTFLEKVEIRDLRARDGITTFGLTVAFKVEGDAGNWGVP